MEITGVPRRLALGKYKMLIRYGFDIALNATSDGEAVEALCRASDEMSALVDLRFEIYERSVEPW